MNDTVVIEATSVIVDNIEENISMLNKEIQDLLEQMNAFIKVMDGK